jgi:hypothetical protein
MKLPKIRTGFIVQELDNEVLIYDTNANKSYCLNSTARIVFGACDGEKLFSDLKLPDELIFFTLDELKKNNLIEDNYVSPFAGINRREVIKKVGLSTMIALPIVSGLVAPSAAMAASGGCSSVCIGPGQDVCAGCTGPATFTAYPQANGGCTGPVFSSFPLNCGGNPAISGPYYHQRN